MAIYLSRAIEHRVSELQATENVIRNGTNLHMKEPKIQYVEKTDPMFAGTHATVTSKSATANDRMKTFVTERMFLSKTNVMITSELPTRERRVIQPYRITSKTLDSRLTPVSTAFLWIISLYKSV